MKTAYNFNAGPCVLPKEAIESTIAAIRDFDNTGIGLLEISHRTPGWERTMEETRQLWRDLLNIPAEYEILFLGGGASTGFMDVPANLLNKKAAYLQTGVWAKKAAKEAKNFGETVIVASSEDKTYSYIPKGWTVPADADYFHITTNNTIYGTEIRKDFAANEINNVMLVADMSSDIMSRPVDVKKYGLIYGGAQKNVGPAGVTFYIVRKDILGKITDRQYMNPLPTMVDF
ncbi:MAG: 3-phosphoserine/phosphohydroxythreonine transaminase, partial [Bacteroidales bacterium]|nr:3-phosphoserine/phosphohydroxythreonine transaminase [Bacteroidales bacterium]